MADTTLSFNILARDNASSTVTKVGQKFGALHMSVGAVAKGIALVGPALAGLAVGAGLKDFINEARESRRIGEITANVIKTTGGAAKVTAKQVGDLATAISNKTGADDEAVQSGQNMLLTFTNIRNGVGKTNKIFDQASQTVVDMAAAMNNGEVSADGVKTASIQLGKALNDPIKGITALRKVGVSFTEDQQKQIKTLVESGKTMEAQKIILGELGKEFGGTAAAAADPMQKLEVVVGNVKEAIGTELLPVVDKAATWLGENLPGAVDTAGKFFKENLLPPLREVSDFTTGTLIPGVGKIVTTFQGLGLRIVKAIGPVDVAGIGKGILEDATGWAKDLITGFKTGITKGDWKPLGTAIGDGLTAAITALQTSGGKIVDALGSWLDSIDWSRIGGKISNAFTGMLKAVDWKRVGSTLGDALIEMIRKTADLGQKLGTAFKEVVAKVDWKQVGRDSTSAIGQFVSGVDWAQLGKIVATSAVKGLKINAEIRQTIINSVTGVLTGAYQELGEWGKKKAEEWGPQLWAGLKSGIVSGAKGIGGWLKTNFVDPIPAWTKKLLGIKSPSTVFATIGLQVVAGFKSGVAGAARGIGSWIYTTLIVPAVTPFVKAGTWLVQHGKNAVAGFKNGASDIAGGIGRWAYDKVIVPLVRPFNNKPGTWLVQQGKNVIAGFKNGMVSIWGSVTKWVSGIATWIKENKGPISLDGRLLIPAGQAIMSGFLKGLKSGAGPAWNFVKGVGGKTVDMLRGEYLNLPGIIPGALSGPNRRVFYQGEALDLGTYNKLAKAMKSVGGINVTQGSYERASSFSGSTHTGGGVFDVVGGNLNRIMSALKASGLIGWIRNPSQGPWPWHIHALDPSETGRMAASARGQVADYYRGGNGLAGYKQGTPWVPDDQWAFLHRGEAVLPREVNEARMRSGGGGGTVVLRVESGGSKMDDLIVEILRKYVRVNGGSVQAVLGR